LAACSVVIPRAQETKKEIEIIATKNNTILLMIEWVYGLKIRNQ
jgi:hypothetical protein